MAFYNQNLQQQQPGDPAVPFFANACVPEEIAPPFLSQGHGYVNVWQGHALWPFMHESQASQGGTLFQKWKPLQAIYCGRLNY
jgi:hypothetical protein